MAKPTLTYRVTAVSKTTGARKVINPKVGALCAARLKMKIEAQGFNCEVEENTAQDINVDQLYDEEDK